MRTTELAIIGAGVAGLTAAAGAARRGLQVLVIERLGAGGQVMTVDAIDGMPGFEDGISGDDLGPTLQERAEVAGAEFMLGEVQGLSSADGQHLLHLDDETVAARVVLVAAGSRRRALGVPGEDRLQGRGVSHCASCDGPLFKGRTVVVVGGGDSAFGEAAVLARYAGHVSVVFAEDRPHAHADRVERLMALPNVELIGGLRVDGVLGETAVAGVSLQRDGSIAARVLKADAVFVYAGLQPDTAFLGDGLVLDQTGRIVTDATLCSSRPGIYAAGDIRAGTPCLLAAVAADGAAAALAIHHHLRQAQTEGDRR